MKNIQKLVGVLVALAVAACTLDTSTEDQVIKDTDDIGQVSQEAKSGSCSPNPQVYTAGSYWSMTTTNTCNAQGKTTQLVYGGNTWVPTPVGGCYCHLSMAGNPTYCNQTVNAGQYVRWECNSTP